MIMHIVTPVITMAALGLVFGVGLAYALKLFSIEVDPTTFMILSKLPGSNCGACGKAGCAAFAEALIKHEAIPAGCVVSNDEARESIAELLGVEHKAKVKLVATLLCNGGNRAKEKYTYQGIKTCQAASLVFGGQKACNFACLEFGDCVTACPFGAIKMGANNLPEVDPNKCTACGICVKICPKQLYELTPVKNHYYVKCKSTDTGAVVSKVCSAGCIACHKCEQACPTAYKVENNLARVNYEKCETEGIEKGAEACPTKVIVKRG